MKRFITLRTLRVPLVLALGLGMVALFAMPGEARKKKGRSTWHPSDRAFQHKAHAKMVKAKGLSLKCAKCHKTKANGDLIRPFSARRDHARCAQKCHGGDFRHHRISKRETGSVSSLKRLYRSDKGRVCYACHSLKKKIQPTNGLSEVNNKPSGTIEHTAGFSHKKHTRPNAATARQCETCHKPKGKWVKASLGGHNTCSACHERGIEPLMNECGGCHVTKKGSTRIKGRRKPNKYATTGAFDHARHEREDRVGVQGKACLTCHSNIAKAKNDTTIPMPSMQLCWKKCHNGKKAFDATGTSCTRCHQGGRK